MFIFGDDLFPRINLQSMWRHLLFIFSIYVNCYVFP